jgi:DNA-binding response OmpR family regulator/regulator of replication initiation timing
MRYRFLIIHNATVILKIIKKFLVRLYGPVEIDTFFPDDQALKKISEEKYHLIYSGLEMAGLNGFDIFDQMRASKVNLNTPFVMMSATDSLRQKDRYKHRGIQFYLTIPCTFHQFRKITRVVLDPEMPDRYMRFIIPKTTADIHIGNQTYRANLINVGMDSMDCELLCPDETAQLIHDCDISIQFPEQYGNVHIKNVRASLLRMTTKARLTDTMPQRLRTSWKFSSTGLDNLSTLEQVIRKAPRSQLDLYEDLENIYEINDQLTQSNETLQEELTHLQKENDRLLSKMQMLEKKLSETQYLGAVTPKDIPLSALINETAKASKDPQKLKIFKRLIDDNVKIRNQINSDTSN